MTDKLSERVRELRTSLGAFEGAHVPAYAEELANEVAALEAELEEWLVIGRQLKALAEEEA